MFTLDKWYLDCVTEAGEAMVAYWAAARFGPLPLRYAACLVGAAAAPSRERRTLLSGPRPVMVDGRVTWACRRVGLTGAWAIDATPIERTLLEGPAGTIRWRCLGPRASADVTIDGRRLTGTGYVEHLTMSVPPWRLPFRELRWGRFHGPGRTVVWIDWRGGFARRWVFDNGIEVPSADVHSAGLTLPGDARIVFDAGRTLRSGRLGETALRPLRAVASRWREAHEAKWLARAQLVAPGGSVGGWVLHEAVSWR